MESLGLTFAEWDALPAYEQRIWLARQIYRERKSEELRESLRDKKGNYNEFTVAAVIALLKDTI